MKNKKQILILINILIILILIIILLIININKKSIFQKPKFEVNATSQIPKTVDYENSIIDISDGYSIYIEGIPHIDKNNLIINFISIKENNIWIKIKVLDEKNNIICESGLIKPGEYLKQLKLKQKVSPNTNLTYMIIGYEKDTYLSAGTIKLNTKVGD